MSSIAKADTAKRLINPLTLDSLQAWGIGVKLTHIAKQEVISYALAEKGDEMRYKVHQLDLKMDNDRGKLEEYLNGLKGEIISIIPNVKPTFQLMGATAKVDFLFIVEKIN